MDSNMAERKIQELKNVRKQIHLWRGGTTALVVGTVVVCLGLLYSDAKALAQPGPTQTVFVERLQSGLNENVVPRLREVASRTLTEMQPVVQKEFVGLNARVPELTQKSLEQVTELQKSLPDRASKALDETFDKAFRDKEASIKTMFPEATEAQVGALFTNLAHITETRSHAIAEELLAPHIDQIGMIQKNLETISGTEGARPGDTGNDWEMGLAVFDVVRDDLKGLTPPKGKAAAMIVDAAGKVSDTARQVADTADSIADKAKKEGGR